MIIIQKLKHESQNKINKFKKKENLLSSFKLIIFTLILYQLFLVFESYNNLKLLLLILLFVFFFVAFIFSSKYIEQIKFNENIIKVSNEIIDEKTENNNKQNNYRDENHPFANDLDIFGKNSLFEKINRCQTSFGISKLSFFLLNHLKNEIEIKETQNSVKELSNKIEWNIHFLARTKSIKSNYLDKKNILFNIKDFKKIDTRFFRFSMVFIPIVNLLAFIFFFISNFSIASTIGLIIPLISSFVFNNIYGEAVKNICSNVNFNSENLKKYTFVFLLVENENFECSSNKLRKEKLFHNRTSASFFIRKLSYLINQYENRKAPIVGGILNGLFLWNLQFGYKIGKSIKEKEKEISNWFDVIGEFEALICFGLFAYKNQDFNYPVCVKSIPSFEAKNLSHPLILKENRIKNNFSIQSDCSVSIITGANMTGKSTFLRSVGINLVLAMNGCPVCADSFVFTPISLFTSMRTADSLSEGSSFFHAEIKRLRFLIEKLENNEPQFILLDEILKGTNSEDKLKGSELFLEKIINMKTKISCLIATHDLDLTKMEKVYPENIENLCFELHGFDKDLIPDYILRKGVTKNMNAINLMKKYKIID